MRGLRSLLILVVLALGLGAYAYFVESKRDPGSATPPREKVFTVESSAITALTVTSEGGDRTALEKREAGWQIVEPVEAKVDESEVTSLASSLSSLEIQRVVEEQPGDLAQYGLDAPRIAVEFKAGDVSGRVLVGRKTPTGGDLYAKLASADRVFLIPAYLESSFNRTTFDLRDKDILAFARDGVDALEITGGPAPLRLAKAGADWRLTAPVAARADYSAVEGLVGRLDGGRLAGIVAEQPGDLTAYGLDKPSLTVRVGSGSAQATLEIGKEAEEGKLYARDASRPMVFTVDKALADEFRKPAADLRRKDLFEFRPFNAKKVEIVRGDRTWAFEKVRGEGDDARDTWTQTAPATAAPDAATLDAVLSAFSNLRAESFADATRGTGLDAPAVIFTVEFGSGEESRRERVAFGTSGDAAWAAIDGDAGAAKLDKAELDKALKALDDLG